MSENPLKQYFRRPAIYIQLPSAGAFNTNEDIEVTQGNELPVYPMSAIDEITARTPDALFNGHAVAEIIKSCIPAIKNPWSITSVDMDTILIAIKIASTGENMDIMCTCPACSTESKFGVNLTKILGMRKKVDYSKCLKIRDLEIKFRPLTFDETNKNGMSQYEVQRMLIEISGIEDAAQKAEQTKAALSVLNNLTAGIITSTIEWIKTPEITVTEKEYIREFITNCDRMTNEAIKDFSVDLREQSNLPPLDIKCIQCGHEYSQQLTLNMTDFFG